MILGGESDFLAVLQIHLVEFGSVFDLLLFHPPSDGSRVSGKQMIFSAVVNARIKKSVCGLCSFGFTHSCNT